MASKVILLFLFYVSANCFSIEHKNRDVAINEMYFKDSQNYQNQRFKREHPALSHKNYVRAVQPNVVVMPNVPNSYGGVPSSSYGVNRAPTVVVSMPNDVYTPVVANPYAIPTRL